MADTWGTRTARQRRSGRWWPGLLVALAAALPLALGAAAPASAHDALGSANPAPDSTVTETVSSVALSFSNELLALAGDTNGFAVQVLDDDERHYESGCVGVSGATASTEVASGPAGTYQVLWQVVSSDGHPISGSYSFTYLPAEPGPQSSQSAAPACGDAWAGSAQNAAATQSPDPTATPESSTPDANASETPAGGNGSDTDAAASGVPLWAIVLGGIAGLGLIAAVIALTLRRSRGFPGENGPH